MARIDDTECLGDRHLAHQTFGGRYGSKLEPSDTLEDFPGVPTVYLLLPWAYLEPEEGKSNWAILDTPAQRWIAKGKKIALRITCSENWMTYATPKWVKDAGAKGTHYRYGEGRVEKVGPWDPFFDDPIFLEKLEAYHASFMSIHGFPKECLRDNREMVDAINKRMGDRIMPTGVTWPTAARIATPQDAFTADKDVTPHGNTAATFKVKWP